MKPRISAKRRRWTPEEDQVLRARFPHERTADIARALQRGYEGVAQRALILKLKKSPEFLASAQSGRLLKNDQRGASTRFQPGQPSWNKGKGYRPGGRCAETQFRPGHKPATWRPIGTEVVDEDGYTKRKVRDDAPKGMTRRNWEFVHRLVWQEHHGPIPEGHSVVFRNGDKTDLRIENLDLVTRRALMARNTVHNLPKPLAQLVQLKGAVMRQINRRSRQHGE